MAPEFSSNTLPQKSWLKFANLKCHTVVLYGMAGRDWRSTNARSRRQITPQ